MKDELGYVVIMAIAGIVIEIVFEVLTWFGPTVALCGGVTILFLFPLFVYLTDIWYYGGKGD